MSDYWNLAKGWFGYRPEEKVGKDLGRQLGQWGSEYFPIPGVNGSQFGEWVGSFLPFKNGGMVPLPVSNISEQIRSENFRGFAKGGMVYNENYHHYNPEAILALENPDPSIPGMVEAAAEWKAFQNRVPRKLMPQPHIGYSMKLQTKTPARYKKWAKDKQKRQFIESQQG
jgi:hypothetical protein